MVSLIHFFNFFFIFFSDFVLRIIALAIRACLIRHSCSLEKIDQLEVDLITLKETMNKNQNIVEQNFPDFKSHISTIQGLIHDLLAPKQRRRVHLQSFHL